MKRLIWILLATWVAATASAQSLVDVAKKEKERRKQVDSSTSRTVTDVELRRAGGVRILLPVSNASSTDDNDDDSDDANGAEDEDAVTDERQTEAYWRGRLAPIDARITSMETRLQGPEFTSNPRGGAARQRLEQDLARAKTERQAVLDEARRKGAPPGWLR